MKTCVVMNGLECYFVLFLQEWNVSLLNYWKYRLIHLKITSTTVSSS